MIINRLEVHKATNDGKRAERAIETMEKTHDFVKSFNIQKIQCGITEAVRLPQRQIQMNGATITTNTVRVTFLSFAHKVALYKALATNGKKNANIRVQDAIPADLMGEKRELEHIGSRWRKESI